MMKRILFTIAMLWSIAYGQSKGYLRYDSVYIQKIGGNGELIIENGTRNVTGGVLTNMGNGRTRFVLPSGGGSSDSSFNSATFGADITAIGNRYVHNWGSTLVSGNITDNTPNMTVTVSGGKTNVTSSGSAFFNLNNRFDVADFPFGAHRFKVTWSAVLKAKSGTSMGMAMKFEALGNGNTYMAHFLTADTTGYIAFTPGASTPPYHGGVNNRGKLPFRWSANDTFDFECIRVDERAILRMTCRATKTTSELLVPDVYTSVGQLALNFYGGDIDLIDDFKVWYADQYQPDWVVMGNSVTYGGNSYNESVKSMAIAFDGARGPPVDYSASNEGSLQGWYRMQEVAAKVKPSYVLWRYGINDATAAIHIDSFTNRLTRTSQLAVDSGIVMVLSTIVPQGNNGVDVTPYNTVINSVASSFGWRVVPLYAAMVANSGTGMFTALDPYDGIHPGFLGHQLDGWVTRNTIKDLINYSPPVVMNGIPVSTQAYWNLQLMEDGTVVKMPRGTDTLQVNTVVTPSGINVQPGSLNQAGSAWFWNGFVAGAPVGSGYPSILNGGILSVHQPGISDGRVRIFTELDVRGLNVTNGIITLGNSVSHPRTDMPSANGAFMSGGNGGYMEFRSLQPGTGQETIRLTTGSGAINTHRHINFYTDYGSGAVNLGYIGDSADLHSTDVNSYLVDLSAQISASDRNIPDVGWVNAAIAAGAGETNTASNLTGTGIGVFKDKSGVDLRFKRLKAGANITITDNTDSITIAASASSGMTNPMTTTGDMIYSSDGSGTPARLGVANNGDVMTLVSGLPAWVAPSAAAFPINDLLAADGTNTINNGAHEQEWQWNTLAGTEGLHLTSTSTAAASNAQRLFAVSLSGTNATSAQTTAAGYFSNTHAGTTSTNYGIQAIASGGTTTNFALFTGSSAGGDGRVNINNATNSANHTVLLKSINNTVDVGLLILANNESQSTAYAYNGVRGSSGLGLAAQSGDVSIATSATSGNFDNNGQINFVVGAGAGLSVGAASFTPIGMIDISGTHSNQYALAVRGTGYTVAGAVIVPSVSPVAGQNAAVFTTGGTLIEAGSGTHAVLAGALIDPPSITGGSATVTNTASLYISNAPSATVTGTNNAILVAAGDTRLSNGNLFLGTAGNKINITTGSNASVGTSTLVGGTVTVSTTAVTASSKIFVTVGVAAGTQGNLSIGTVTAGTSFVINSTSGTETSQVNWWIIN